MTSTQPEKPIPPRRTVTLAECNRNLMLSSFFTVCSILAVAFGSPGSRFGWMGPLFLTAHVSLFAYWAYTHRRLRRGETVLVADNTTQAAVPRVVSISAAALLRVVATIFSVTSLWLVLEAAPRSPSILLLLGVLNAVAWWLVFHVENRIAADAAAAIPASETTATSAASAAPEAVASSGPKRWWTADATREEIRQDNRR